MTSAGQRSRFGAWIALVLAWGLVARVEAARADADDGADDEYRRTVAAAIEEFESEHFTGARGLFERAHRIQPSARTLRGMSFADFENQHYALALNEIEAALADSRKPLDAQQRGEAEELLARLKPLVGTLDVRVVPAGAALFVNGFAMSAPSMRLDPGEYVVRATADGYAQAETRVRIEAGQESQAELALVAIAREHEANAGWGTQRTVALVAGGVGAAAVIVGSIFGVRSIVKHNESDEHCSDAGACRDARGVEAMNQARIAGNISTAAWVIGGLGLAGAGVLWFTAPERASAAASRTRLGVGVAALQLETRW